MVHTTLIAFRVVKHRHCFAFLLTTGPQTLPKRVLQTVRPSAAYFNFQYLLTFLSISNSRLCFLPSLPLPYTFLSIASFSQDVTYRISLFFLFFVCRILFPP